MTKIRATIVAFLTAMMIALTGASAQAATDNYICTQYGGKIAVRSDSDAGVRVWNSGPSTSGCGYNGIGVGQSSRNYSNQRDVDKFFVGTYWYCRSQWGYVYQGGGGTSKGTWFTLANDSVDLVLYCKSQGI